MKELNPLQLEYLQQCKLLQALNMPTDLFDELYKMQSSELYKELKRLNNIKNYIS